MSIFYLKSILSVVLLILACVSMITMFEVYGRTTSKYDPAKLTQLHRLSGRLYFILFIVISD